MAYISWDNNNTYTDIGLKGEYEIGIEGPAGGFEAEYTLGINSGCSGEANSTGFIKDIVEYIKGK
jgi:hypothetical protein